MTRLARVPVVLWWIVPALLVVEAVNANRPRLMWVEWTTTLDVVNGAYVILGPLCAGMSCALAVSVARRWEMVRTLPDSGLRALLFPTVLTAGLFIGVHLLTTVVIVVVGRVRGLDGWPSPLPVIAVAAVFAASASVGTALARVSGSLIAAPLSVLLVYAYQIVEPRVADRLFSDFGGASVLLLGLRQRPEVILWQTLWLLATSALVIVIACWGRRVLTRWTIAAPLVLAVLISAIGLAQGPETRFAPTAVTWVCEGDDPEVCVLEEYQSDLSAYAERVGRFADALGVLGAPVPETFTQAVGASFPEGGAFSITSGRNDETLVSQIVQSTFPCSQTWTETQLDASDVVVSYLVGGPGSVLYPGATPATDEATSAALDEMACPG